MHVKRNVSVRNHCEMNFEMSVISYNGHRRPRIKEKPLASGNSSVVISTSSQGQATTELVCLFAWFFAFCFVFVFVFFLINAHTVLKWIKSRL